MRHKFYLVTLLMSCLLITLSARAASFDLPVRGDDIVGNVQTYMTKPGETFVTLAEKFDVGYFNLIETNPGVDPGKAPAGTMVIIPRKYVLPNAPREDIIINLAELRLYYFPSAEKKVYIYPVGIGRKETGTPTGYMHIIQHIKDPAWHSPESVRIERAKVGIAVPKVVQPGPDNPLGKFAMRLSRPTYLIHGTNDNSGVGRRSSAGCIRMFPDDIKELFYNAKNGAHVLVINDPVKVGRHDNKVYLESHLPLQGTNSEEDMKMLKQYMHASMRGIIRKYNKNVNWNKLLAIATEQQGIPQS